MFALGMEDIPRWRPPETISFGNTRCSSDSAARFYNLLSYLSCVIQTTVIFYSEYKMQYATYSDDCG